MGDIIVISFRKFTYIVIIAFLLLICGCNKQHTNKSYATNEKSFEQLVEPADSSIVHLGGYGHRGFDATIINISEKGIIVQPFENSLEFSISDKIFVTFDTISPTLPELSVGDDVRVVYNALDRNNIANEYPAQINSAFKIYVLSELTDISR